MKKSLLLIAITLASICTFAQQSSYLRADTLRVTNRTKAAVFIIENSTKSVSGFAKNAGSGRVEFSAIAQSDVTGLTTQLNLKADSARLYGVMLPKKADSTRLYGTVLPGYLQKANNLSDVASVTSSQNNLSLGHNQDVTHRTLTFTLLQHETTAVNGLLTADPTIKYRTWQEASTDIIATLAATTTGTNTYLASLTPAITSYVTNQLYYITFTNANTIAGTVTLNINSVGTTAVKKAGSQDLEIGDIAAGQTLVLQYDGTNFQIVGSSGVSLPTQNLNGGKFLKTDGANRSWATITPALIGAQAKIISANPSAPSSTILAGDSVNMGLYKLQAQINTNSLLGSTKIFYTSKMGLVDDASLAMESTTFGTDNTASMQAILNNASSTTPITVYVDGHYSATQLQVLSNTKIVVLPGCGFIQRTNSNVPFIKNTHQSTGSTGVVESNIEIDGGIWNGNGQVSGTANQSHDGGTSGTGWNTIFRFSGVNNLIMRDITTLNSRTMAIMINNSSNIYFQNWFTNLPATLAGSNDYDGVHFIGPMTNVVVKNLYGNSQDDLIALDANDVWQTTNPSGNLPLNGSTYDLGASVGNITDVFVDGINFQNTKSGIRLLSTAALLGRINISNVMGTVSQQWLVCDYYTENPSYINNGGLAFKKGNISSVRIDNVNVTATTGGYKPAQAYIHTIANEISITNYKRPSIGNGYPSLMVDTGSTINRLNISHNFSMTSNTNTSAFNIIQLNGNINHINIFDSAILRDSATSVVNMFPVDLGASLVTNDVSLNNVTASNTSAIAVDEGATIPVLLMNNIRLLSSVGWALQLKATSVISSYYPNNISAPSQIAFFGSSSITKTYNDGYGLLTSFATGMNFSGIQNFINNDNAFNTQINLSNTNTGTNAFSGVNLTVNGITIGGIFSLPSNFTNASLASSTEYTSLGNNRLLLVADANSTGTAQDIDLSTLGTNSTYQMVIKGSTGNVLINNNTDNGSGAKLQVNGLATIKQKGVGTAGTDSLVTSGTNGKLNVIAANYYATSASPALTGTPTAPTPGSNINTTQIPTTAWVNTYYSPLASPQFTGAAHFTGIQTTSNTFSAGATTATTSNYIIQGNATSGTVTVNLPAANTVPGQTYIIKKIDGSANTVVITPNGADTVDGAASLTVSVQYKGYTIQASGNAWLVIGSF